MQWFNRIVKRHPKAFVESGWHLDKPNKDYNKLLVCKKCNHRLPIKDCRKQYIGGSPSKNDSDRLASLHCVKCGTSLAIINEGQGDFRPRLILEEHGKFVRRPGV